MSIPLAWHILLGTEPEIIAPTQEQIERAKHRLSEIGDRKPEWFEVELKQEIESLKAVARFEKNLSDPDFELTDFAEQVKIK